MNYFKNMLYQPYLLLAYIITLFLFLSMSLLIFSISVIFMPLNILLGQNSYLLEQHITNILDSITINKYKNKI